MGDFPATGGEIVEAEEQLGVRFPADYRELLSISNGFPVPSGVDPGFLPVGAVNLLIEEDPYLVESYDSLGSELKTALLIGGKNEEQYFLLLPPNDDYEEWGYWKFANWIPGEHAFEDLTTYWHGVLQSLEKELESEGPRRDSWDWL